MPATATQVLDPEPADSVRWEPCPEPTLDDGGSLCSACGWPAEDHDRIGNAGPARAA